MMNFLFCTVLHPAAFKFYQTHKFDDFGTDVLDFIIECFDREEIYQKLCFKQFMLP